MSDDWSGDGDSAGGGAWDDQNDNDSWGDDGGAEFEDSGGMVDEDGGGADIEIANLFYEGEDLLRDRPSEALSKFRQLVKRCTEDAESLSEESRSSLFHSLVHISMLEYQFGGVVLMLPSYRQLLQYIPKVTRNEAAEAIEKILNSVGSGPSAASHSDSDSASASLSVLLREVYLVTCQCLESLPDTERLIFNVKMKLCKSLVEQNDIDSALSLLGELHRLCQTGDGADDRKNRGSELVEIYAIQIKLAMQTHDTSKMRELYEKTKDLTAAVKDPRSQSLIRECWGQMFGDEGQWQRAYAEFYSAFTHYQEIGNREKAKQCLKYVVVANMLSGGEQNPFDAREAKVYQADADIAAVVGLRSAYERCDVQAFAAALAEINKSEDRFLRTHLAAMVRDFQSRAVLQLIKAYRRIRIEAIARAIKLEADKVQAILVQLILDGDLVGRIDQVQGIVDLTESAAGGNKKYQAIQKWNDKLALLAKANTQTRITE